MGAPYEFTWTTLAGLSASQRLPLERGRATGRSWLSRTKLAHAPDAPSLKRVLPPREVLDACDAQSYESLRGRMIAEQEELDWEVYRLYGLIDEDLTYAGRRLASACAR